MATLIDSIVPCYDPSTLYQHCLTAQPPLPVDWAGQANLFRIPLGRGPGTGGVLLKDFQLSDLDQTIDHELTFLDAKGTTRTLKKITFLKSRCLTPGAPVNDHGLFLCDLVDRRFHLARIPIDKAYNISTADGTSYLVSSLNSGASWTWQTMVQNIATALGLGTMTLPFTPNGNPENFIFWGGFAWDALNQICDRLACTIKYDIEADTFAILRQGDAAAAAAVIAEALLVELAGKQFKTWDDYHNEPVRGRFPAKIRVTFPRRPQPTDGTSIYYLLDVALTGGTGVEPGTYEILHDDLTAVGAGVPTNAAALATRAAERAADWVRKRTYAEARTTIVYRDFQEGMKLLAETTGGVAYDDREFMGTELSSGPDGLMERFRPYEQPFVLFSGGRAPFVANLSEATGPASWQSRTLAAGVWGNDTASGTNNAYPVQIFNPVSVAYETFAALATAPTLMWEEPVGSGVYAFLPIQYASLLVPGFVSLVEQTFAGYKRFQIIGFAAGPTETYIQNENGVVMAFGNAYGASSHGGFGVKGGAGTFPGIDAAITTGGFTYTFKGGILISAA